MILTSTDGQSWTDRASLITNDLYGIAFGSSEFVGVGFSGAIVSSLDGITWTSRPSGTSHFLSGIAYANGTFVTVGEAGTILEAAPLTAPTPPTLGPILLLPKGAAQITLTGTAGQRYRLEASTNLESWAPITDIVLKATSGEFIDPSATNFSRRFYRAVVGVQ